MKESIKRIISPALLAAAILCLATACIDGDDNDFTGIDGVRTALVTYSGETNVEMTDGTTGYVSAFAYYGADNTVSTCRTTVETHLPDKAASIGQRMVITYTQLGGNTQQYPTGTIELKSYTLVPTIALQTVSHETAIGATAEMPLIYYGMQPGLNRTGNYINLEVQLPVYTEREYVIYADETTLQNAMPDLYISTNPKGQSQGLKALQIASFDISEIWRNPSVTGVSIHINNTAGTRQQVFEFLRNEL